MTYETNESKTIDLDEDESGHLAEIPAHILDLIDIANEAAYLIHSGCGGEVPAGISCRGFAPGYCAV